jgi:hypothetical protein
MMIRETLQLQKSQERKRASSMLSFFFVYKRLYLLSEDQLAVFLMRNAWNALTRTCQVIFLIRQTEERILSDMISGDQRGQMTPFAELSTKFQYRSFLLMFRRARSSFSRFLKTLSAF